MADLEKEERINRPSLIELARDGEGGTGDLLGVEAERAHEGAVLVTRQRSRQSLRREVVAETGLVCDVGRKIGVRGVLCRNLHIGILCRDERGEAILFYRRGRGGDGNVFVVSCCEEDDASMKWMEA